MKAKLWVDGEMLREIEVENGLRQGCTMAPLLFNLYACVMAERWLEMVCDVEGVGTCLFYKCDQQLFQRYTKNASEDVVRKCEFADDVALLATNHAYFISAISNCFKGIPEMQVKMWYTSVSLLMM